MTWVLIYFLLYANSASSQSVAFSGPNAEDLCRLAGEKLDAQAAKISARSVWACSKDGKAQ